MVWILRIKTAPKTAPKLQKNHAEPRRTTKELHSRAACSAAPKQPLSPRAGGPKHLPPAGHRSAAGWRTHPACKNARVTLTPPVHLHASYLTLHGAALPPKHRAARPASTSRAGAAWLPFPCCFNQHANASITLLRSLKHLTCSHFLCGIWAYWCAVWLAECSQAEYSQAHDTLCNSLKTPCQSTVNIPQNLTTNACKQ